MIGTNAISPNDNSADINFKGRVAGRRGLETPVSDIDDGHDGSKFRY